MSHSQIQEVENIWGTEGSEKVCQGLLSQNDTVLVVYCKSASSHFIICSVTHPTDHKYISPFIIKRKMSPFHTDPNNSHNTWNGERGYILCEIFFLSKC